MSTSAKKNKKKDATCCSGPQHRDQVYCCNAHERVPANDSIGGSVLQAAKGGAQTHVQQTHVQQCQQCTMHTLR